MATSPAARHRSLDAREPWFAVGRPHQESSCRMDRCSPRSISPVCWVDSPPFPSTMRCRRRIGYSCWSRSRLSAIVCGSGQRGVHGRLIGRHLRLSGADDFLNGQADAPTCHRAWRVPGMSMGGSRPSRTIGCFRSTLPRARPSLPKGVAHRFSSSGQCKVVQPHVRPGARQQVRSCDADAVYGRLPGVTLLGAFAAGEPASFSRRAVRPAKLASFLGASGRARWRRHLGCRRRCLRH